MHSLHALKLPKAPSSHSKLLRTTFIIKLNLLVVVSLYKIENKKMALGLSDNYHFSLKYIPVSVCGNNLVPF